MRAESNAKRRLKSKKEKISDQNGSDGRYKPGESDNVQYSAIKMTLLRGFNY
jgi:hypothetical protein